MLITCKLEAWEFSDRLQQFFLSSCRSIFRDAYFPLHFFFATDIDFLFHSRIFPKMRNILCLEQGILLYYFTVYIIIGLPFSSFDALKEENEKLHHTDKYKVEDLVLRRGQSFDVKISLTRPFTKDDEFKFVMTTGKMPRASDKTLVEIEKVDDLKDPRMKEKWAFAQYPQLTREMRSWQKFKINIPGDALPGRYKMTIETDEESVYSHPTLVYILFNPWSRGLLFLSYLSFYMYLKLKLEST